MTNYSMGHENPMNSIKSQKKTPKVSLSGWKLSNILLGKSGGQLLIVPERTK